MTNNKNDIVVATLERLESSSADGGQFGDRDCCMSLLRTVDTIVSNKEAYRRLLMSRDDQARLQIDALHSVSCQCSS